VCTVVVRRSVGEEPVILALRDELTSRPFDDPGAWWPDQPSVVGGRDQVAGGSWCVTDVGGATTALVLNRPLRRLAEPGAPSRGVLPLLAVEHGQAWPEHVDVTGMATFTVVLVTPATTTVWDFDGQVLERRDLEVGTHMITSGGVEDGKAERFLPVFSTTPTLGWADLLRQAPPVDDRTALVVRHEGVDEDGHQAVFATVFGQLITGTQISFSRQPWTATPWNDL
jgi:hypothetical protein